MPNINYRSLPKIRDSLSYIYLEYGRIEQTKNGVEFINKGGSYQVPTANLTAIMLGPGTTVTHAGMKSIVQSGCLVIWSGQEGVRCYAHGLGETSKAYKLQKQAELVSDPEKRKHVALKMYRTRFGKELSGNLSFEQIQGFEGKRVKAEYEKTAEKYGVEWKGRNYDRDNWDNSDELNRALSTASSCLNGITHSAILSAGYSPGLGFIHQGRQMSFVYDIADLYKMKVAVPIAFAAAAENVMKLETVVRQRCRQAFRNTKLLARIIPDIDKLLNTDDELPDGFDPDEDPYLPTNWWEPIEEEEG